MMKGQLFLVVILILSLIVSMNHNIIFAKKLSDYGITVKGTQKPIL